MAEKPRNAVELLPLILPAAKECIQRLNRVLKESPASQEGDYTEAFTLHLYELDALMVCVAVADAYQTARNQMSTASPRIVLQ